LVANYYRKPLKNSEIGLENSWKSPGIFFFQNSGNPVTNHPGQLSLAKPPWVGAMSTGQRAVMLCGWGVKAGMARVW